MKKAHFNELVTVHILYESNAYRKAPAINECDMLKDTIKDLTVHSSNVCFVCYVFIAINKQCDIFVV